VKLETFESDEESEDDMPMQPGIVDPGPDNLLPDSTFGLVEQDPRTSSLYKLLERIVAAPDDFRVLNMLSDQLYNARDVGLSYLFQMSLFERVRASRH
jgi:hypothetical protein